MSVRTHLNLRVRGEPQVVPGFGKCATEVILMENYCIGRLFFDELPSGCLEVLERHSLPEVYFVEGTTNEGEIQVGSLLAILQHIKEIQTSSKEKPTDTWYELEVKNLIEQLEQAVIVDLVDSESYVQFTCF